MTDLETRAKGQGSEQLDFVEVLAWSSARFQAPPQTALTTLNHLNVDFRTNQNFTALTSKRLRYRGAAYEEIAVVDLLMVFLDAYIAKNPMSERADRHRALFLRSIGHDWDGSLAEAYAFRVSVSNMEARLRSTQKSYSELLPKLGIAPRELSEAHGLTVVLCQAQIDRLNLTRLTQLLHHARPTLTRNQIVHFLRSRVRIARILSRVSRIARAEQPQEQELVWLPASLLQKNRATAHNRVPPRKDFDYVAPRFAAGAMSSTAKSEVNLPLRNENEGDDSNATGEKYYG